MWLQLNSMAPAVLSAARVFAPPPAHGSCSHPATGYQCALPISHHWGEYAPWFAVASDIPDVLPPRCDLTFAQVLARHGSRYPDGGTAQAMRGVVLHIQQTATGYAPGYELLRDYRYDLATDALTALGRQEMFDMGAAFYDRYRPLARARGRAPFVRASGSSRVVASARNFTQGFHARRLADGDGGHDDDDPVPYDVLVLPESSAFNNSLEHTRCPRFESTYPASAAAAQDRWTAVFVPPLLDTLRAALPGTDLAADQLLALMHLCPFATVADPRARPSPVCSLFDDDAWADYGWWRSLGQWYAYGPGEPLGPSQGVGFATELVARLTDTRVRGPAASLNATLDADPRTFPLPRDGTVLFADFTHESDITSVLAALGLLNATRPLANETRGTPEETAGYSAARTVPFAARVYVEKMRCADDDDGEERVRVLVNDRVVPLLGCGADALGRCALGRFVESLSFVRQGGHWGQCGS